MTHEGSEIYAAWFDELIKKYKENFGAAKLPEEDRNSLCVAADTICRRLTEINRVVQPNLLESREDFLRKYTSIDMVRSAIFYEKLTRHTEDTIGFMVRTPIGVAYNTWEHSILKDEKPSIKTVVDMLRDPSYQVCMEDLATTGFGILGTSFSDLYRFSRDHRRSILGANSDDPELIEVTQTTDGYHYSIAEWAKKSLQDGLSAQNKDWHGHQTASRGQAGRLINLPGPISSGCPARNISIKPLCQFLSEQIEPVNQTGSSSHAI